MSLGIMIEWTIPESFYTKFYNMIEHVSSSLSTVNRSFINFEFVFLMRERLFTSEKLKRSKNESHKARNVAKGFSEER
jgi:hypothetical protein